MESELQTFFDEKEAMEYTAPRKQKTQPWLKVGITFIALSAAALLACNYASYVHLFQHDLTPLEHVTRMQHKVMSAFTSRALASAVDFETSMELFMKEDGADDPNAMTLKAHMKVDKEGGKWPKLTKVFIAKPGKQADLRAKLTSLWKTILDVSCKHDKNPEQCKKDAPALTIKKRNQARPFGNGEFVIAEMPLPKGKTEEQVDEKLKKALKDHEPQFKAGIFVGRDIENMYKHKDSNIAVLSDGFGIKISAGLATSVFQAFESTIPPNFQPMFKAIYGFAHFKARQELLYKKDPGDAFDGLPTFGKEIDGFKKKFKQSVPPEVQTHLKGLPALMAGVQGFVLEGLPYDWEVVGEFTNFHPSPVLASMLSE